MCLKGYWCTATEEVIYFYETMPENPSGKFIKRYVYIKIFPSFIPTSPCFHLSWIYSPGWLAIFILIVHFYNVAPNCRFATGLPREQMGFYPQYQGVKLEPVMLRVQVLNAMSVNYLCSHLKFERVPCWDVYENL